jgi:hypothetical protein
MSSHQSEYQSQQADTPADIAALLDSDNKNGDEEEKSATHRTWPQQGVTEEVRWEGHNSHRNQSSRPSMEMSQQERNWYNMQTKYEPTSGTKSSFYST